jgi:2-phosphosulfolactate phosphatase
MRLDVALVPSEARRWSRTVCVLLDELRASSTIVTLLERGATAVVPAASLAEARRIARAIGPAAVLAGEHDVVRAPGFDLGNSPAEVAFADLQGRTAVLSTRNGTAVLRGLPAGTPVVIGCLLNATVVARAALAIAREAQADLGIICAGRRGAFAIDDAIAAGCILERVLAAAGVDDRDVPTADGRASTRSERPAPDGDLALTDASLAALQLWRSTPDLAAAFRASWSGHLLASVDLLEDMAASIRVDSSLVVPVLVEGTPPRIEPRRA